jgi:hypothetical protein
MMRDQQLLSTKPIKLYFVRETGYFIPNACVNDKPAEGYREAKRRKLDVPSDW